MIENCPTCNPDAVYSVKQTCAELGICRKTLRKLRLRGIITPCNTNRHRYKYTGQSIVDCWKTATRL